MIDIDGETAIELANNHKIRKSDIEGKGWLRMERVADKEFPVFIWRNNIGRINKEALVAIDNAEESDFELSYDNEIVTNLSARKLNNDRWSW